MSNFVKARHAQFAAPDEVIFDFAKKATGQETKQKQRIIEGEDSEVYDLTVQDGQHFILKIKRFGDVGYSEEAWAINACRKTGVPVSEIAMVDTREIDGQIRDVMIMKKLGGSPFRQILDQKKLTRKQADQVFEQAGKFLRKINSIKVGGYWRPWPGGRWDFDSWENYIESSVRDRVRDKQYILDSGFSHMDFDFMMKMHRLYEKKFPCRQPVLCHGDYTPEHWFVDVNLNITGIIDFGDIQGGAKVTDLAIISSWEPKLKMESLIHGYFQGKPWPDFEERLNLHKIIWEAGCLIHFTKQNNKQEIKSTKSQLRKTLRWLKKFYAE